MATVKKSTSKSVQAKASKAPAQNSKPIGFVGLGIMGSAMSSNMVKAGFKVCGFDPLPAARKSFRAQGGVVCKDAAEVASSVDVVVFSLPNPDALMSTSRAVALRARKGLVVIETSTFDVEDKMAARAVLAARGVVMLDCPLSGTGAQARLKDLTVYSSGPAKVVQQLKPVFEGFSKANYYLGEFGNGMKMKLMANLLVAIHNVSTAEALLFGKRLGIAPDLAVKVLADGAGGSRMLDVRGPVMAQESWDDATMKVSIWQKDMKLINAALAATKTPAPLFTATEAIYNAALGAGHGDHDTAAVYDVLRRMCGG